MDFSCRDTLPVAVLGATGAVGQKVIALLQQHPRYHVAEVVASPEKEGRPYGEVVGWREPLPLSYEVATLCLRSLDHLMSPVVISALPSSVAASVEMELAERGHLVFSNASAWRQDPRIPLLIPEINPDHLELLDQQDLPGKLITNPNCAAVVAALGLAPLQRLAEIKRVHLVTLQAVSGAGFSGYSAMEMMNNVIPHIEGEEAKIEQELPKIFGSLSEPADFSVQAQVHRVPVPHGHMVALKVQLSDPVTPEAVKRSFRGLNDEYPGLYTLYEGLEHPQILRDLGDYDQGVHVGKIKTDPEGTWVSLVVLGHNLVRGAAGAAIANLEATLFHLEHTPAGI